MLTVSIIGLLVATLVSQVQERRFRLASPGFFVASGLVTLAYLITVYYSDSIIGGLDAAKVKGMFLVIPYILLSLYRISEWQKKILFHTFCLVAIILAGWSLLQIPIQRINLTEYYAQGKVLPTAIHHIRFSLLVAFATVMLWLLGFRRPEWRILPRYAYLAIAALMTVYLHILAVRSGLAGFYAAMFFLVVVSFANGRRLGLKAGALILGIISVFAAFQFSPSLRAKVSYTVYSIDRYVSGAEDLGLYSDNRRLISYEAAIALIKKHPFIGVGVGDVRSRINEYYDAYYPNVDQTNLHPHNQYLFTAVAAGIPVALYLLIFNFMLLFQHFKRRDWLLVSFNIIWMISFLVEDTLEMQIGVIVYLFFNFLSWPCEAEKASI